MCGFETASDSSAGPMKDPMRVHMLADGRPSQGTSMPMLLRVSWTARSLWIPGEVGSR